MASRLPRRYPQINLDGIASGIYEPESGVLLARRAVAAVVAEAIRVGVELKLTAIREPRGNGAIENIAGSSGEQFAARQFVFACGAWLAKLFPEILGTGFFPRGKASFTLEFRAESNDFRRQRCRPG